MATILELNNKFTDEINKIKSEMSTYITLKKGFRTNVEKSLDNLLKVYNELKSVSENNTIINSAPNISYAQAVTKSMSKTQLIKSKHVIAITPKDINTTSNDLRKIIKEKINTTTINIGINLIKNISKGGILLECDSNEDINKFSQHLNETVRNLAEIKIPTKKSPKMIIYNLSNDITKEELIEAIPKQNPLIADLLSKSRNIESQIKFKFFTKSNFKDCKNAVIEVPPELRKLLINLNKINIVWSKCSVKDYIIIMRCFKCLSFGHLSKDKEGNNCCKNDIRCSYCAEDHSFKDCTKNYSQNHNTCINCINHNVKTKNQKFHYNINHSAMDKNCPVFKYVENQIKSKTNYGD
jgi:hypothetical protein